MNVLGFNESTQTIRQMPQNYLIAQFDGKRWTCEPDLAADKNLVRRVFLELLTLSSKYQKDGLVLLGKLTPNEKHQQTYTVVFKGRNKDAKGYFYNIKTEVTVDENATIDEIRLELYNRYEHITNLKLHV